jgi:hypothetical protein
MTITLRTTKGSALTFAELDANFTDLDGRLDTVEDGNVTQTDLISALQSSVSSNDDDITTLNTTVSGYGIRITNLESDMSEFGTKDIDFGSNQITYSNIYANAAAFPSATTYEGMFIVSDSDGEAYFSHNNAWKEIPSLVFKTVTGNTGTVTASTGTDTFSISGDSGISTALNLTSDGLNISLDHVTYNFTAENDSAAALVFQPDDRFFLDSASNPTLYLRRGETYKFNITSLTHPIYIKTAQSTGTGDQYTNGVINNGQQAGVLTFTPPMNAPATLYYQASSSADITGTINIV